MYLKVAAYHSVSGDHLVLTAIEGDGHFSSTKVNEGEVREAMDFAEPLFALVMKIVPQVERFVLAARNSAEGNCEGAFGISEMVFKQLKTLSELEDYPRDFAAMVNVDDSGLRGQELADYWDNIGRGGGGFYDSIREHGCSSCGSHTPGCCDGCA